MTVVNVKSFLHLHSIIEERYSTDKPIIYRGVKNVNYKLIPKIGRFNYTLRKEKDMFCLFKMQGVPFLEYEPESDWDWIAIAQHHGLPTRLMDWTYNPLVAAYFAVEETSTDSAIYVMPAPIIIDTNRERYPIVKGTGVDVFMPSHVERRIAVQSGLFTIHWAPQEPLKNSIDKLIIQHSLHKKLREMLYIYGIHRGTLFPDLDGQARSIEWLKMHR